MPLSYLAMAMPAPYMAFHALIMERAEGPFFLTGLGSYKFIDRKKWIFLYFIIATFFLGKPQYTFDMIS